MSNPINDKRVRFAIYTRYSSEMQTDLSLEAQEARCRRAIIERGGVVIKVFSDGARSGWSLERDGFKQLCKAAEHGQFDAIMFWKFDRLARNHEHAVMIKMLLRHEYGLKLYCVEGFSEDEDDSPYTALMEQMLAVFSAFYSKNLSSDTKRGKRQRALNGEFNGSVPPLGFYLVTIAEATAEKPPGLYICLRQAAIVRRAFLMYTTGNHTDFTIANWLNSRKEIQKLRAGKPPIGKDTVRDLLQNRTYTGRVCYSETVYTGSMGQGRKCHRKRKEWYEGKHEGFISGELFEKCQQVRQNLAKDGHLPEKKRTYILQDRVFCARCTVRKPMTLKDVYYGKMRPVWYSRLGYGRYRCVARHRGYIACEQSYVDTKLVDAQVLQELFRLTIPDGLHGRIEDAVRNNVENEVALKQMEEIEAVAKRIDFSWEKGFLTPEEYVKKRRQLQRETESLRPVDFYDLIRAAELLGNFSSHWEACARTENPVEARKQLLAKIVDRVFVYDNTVIAIALCSNYSVVLNRVDVSAAELFEKVRSQA